VMVLLGSVVRARCPKDLSRSDLTLPDTGEQAVMLRIVSLVVCLVYGIRKIAFVQIIEVKYFLIIRISEDVSTLSSVI